MHAEEDNSAVADNIPNSRNLDENLHHRIHFVRIRMEVISVLGLPGNKKA